MWLPFVAHPCSFLPGALSVLTWPRPTGAGFIGGLIVRMAKSGLITRCCPLITELTGLQLFGQGQLKVQCDTWPIWRR